jgi:hypothetical protein
MQGEMLTMDRTGHTEITWNSDNADEVATARAVFREMRDKGYRAFRTGRRGERGARMDDFDPQAEAIMLVPHMQGG